MPRIATQPQLVTPAITGAATLKPSTKPNVAANNTVINSNIAAWSGVDSMHSGSFENSVRADAWSNHNRVDASNYNHSGSATDAGNAAAVLNNAGVGHNSNGYGWGCINGMVIGANIGSKVPHPAAPFALAAAGCVAGMYVSWADGKVDAANSCSETPNSDNNPLPNDNGCEGDGHWTDTNSSYGSSEAVSDALNRAGVGHRELPAVGENDQGGGEKPSSITAGGQGTAVGNYTEDGPTADGIKRRPNLKPRRADLLVGPDTRTN